MTRFQYNGGNMMGSDKKFNEWASTVPANPWIIYGKLLPITDLLPDNLAKKGELEKAAATYMVKAHIEELFSVSKLYNDRPEFRGQRILREIIQKLEEARKTTIPDRSIPISLEKKLYDYVKTPDWFKQSQICTGVPELSKPTCIDIGRVPTYNETKYVCRFIENGQIVWGEIPFLAPDEIKCFAVESFFKAATGEGQSLLNKYAKITFKTSDNDYGLFADTKVSMMR